MIVSLWPYLNQKLEKLWTFNWQQMKAQFKFYIWGYTHVAWVSISEIMTGGRKFAISNWLLRFVFQKRWFFSGADFNALHQKYDQKYKTKVSGNGLKYTWLIIHKHIWKDVDDSLPEVVVHFFFHFQMIFEKWDWSLWLSVNPKLYKLWTCN